MKTKNQMKPLARLIATSLAVGSMAGFGAQAFAQTAAGTLIKNLATVTYEDENGNEYSAQSNEAVVTVAPVYSAIIEKDNALSAAPGQTVYFPHILSNTGNVEDTYTLSASPVIPTIGGVAGTPLVGAVTVFNDLNGNGQPDPGEPELTDLTVAAGEQKNIVVAIAVPVDAPDSATYSTTLSAATPNATVLDENGLNDESNDDIATVSTGPVLVLNKSSVHDVENNQITYTLTVKNNGSTDATNVNIIDALPEVDTDNDGVPDTQVTLVSSSIAVSGLVNTGDIVPQISQDADEAVYGDLNFDGDVADEPKAIIAQDDILPANTTVTVVYTVDYPSTFPAGADIDNTFVVSDDSSADPVASNTTHDEVPQTYDVLADNTGINDGLGVNDGGDDDSDPANDSQYVDVAPTGAEVEFNHVITNESNGDDTYNINVVSDATDGFPVGTVFTYWDATGTVQLTDTDDDGFPDTGVLGATGTATDSTTIKIKAKLPAGESGTQATGFNATLTATSSKDPSSTPADDVTKLKLGEITPPNVDIANDIDALGQGADKANGFNDGDVASPQNAQDEAPAYLVDGATNSVVTFDLKLANESGSADSYTLGANNVPAGWDVVFKDTVTGDIITTTSLVPGAGVFKYQAVVTISANPAEAMSDSDQIGAVDGYDDSNNGSSAPAAGSALTDADTDLDYQINFTATSTSTPSVTDSLTNAIDITPEREVVITPNGQNQVQPGGTVDYSHKLENNGNQTELLELGSGNTQPGWTTIINVVDENGNDVILTSALAGTNIQGIDDNGNPVLIEVTDNDGDGIPELNLEPGENVDMTSTVTSPSNAPLGSVDTSTLSVADGAIAANPAITSAQDQTTVVFGQIRLDKTAAINESCDGDSTNKVFLATQTQKVEPGQCVIWRLTATNEGSATVQNVVISDAAPEFTDIVAGKLRFCHGNACTPLPVDDAATDTDQGLYANGLVQFFAGNSDDTVGAVPSAGTGGELIAGEQATGEFTVKVQ